MLAAAPDGEAHLSDEARDALLQAPYEEQMDQVRRLAARRGIDGIDPSCVRRLRRDALYLDDTALLRVQAGGLVVGAHGVEHVRWTTLADEVLAREAANSAAWLRSLGQRSMRRAEGP
ncbi:MAG: hypothetical protein IT373_34155 [Polyangiaceae bacterium]|nr:hypothetical protein [Polyangiaceae bacterium]